MKSDTFKYLIVDYFYLVTSSKSTLSSFILDFKDLLSSSFFWLTLIVSTSFSIFSKSPIEIWLASWLNGTMSGSEELFKILFVLGA